MRLPRSVRVTLPGGRLRRAATHNAQRALDDVRRAVADRAALHDSGPPGVTQLSRSETEELLQRQSVARLAYVAREGVPDVVPVNYLWSGGSVLIRSGPGPKLQAAQRRDMVALEVDELDPVTRTGRSAVVIGRAEVLDATKAAEVDVWAEGPRRHVIRVVPTRVSGRRVG